jgi:hypothetical protein
MSDSLVLKGLKDVRKHTGSEMLLMNPKRGGNSYPVKKWWAMNAAQTTYVGCSVFKVSQAGDSVYLAIDTGEMTTIRIDSADSFVFNFYNIHQISRAALFTDSWELIEHYAFPKISGGKIMTITPPSGASRPDSSSPGVETATSIGTVTVTGDTSPSDGDTVTYTAAVSGDASNLSYAWSMNNSGTVISFNGASVQGEWSGTDESTVTCIVTSSDSDVTDSPSSGSITVTPV